VPQKDAVRPIHNLSAATADSKKGLPPGVTAPRRHPAARDGGR